MKLAAFPFIIQNNYGASEAVNLCSRYVEKSTKCLEQNCASSFLENKISRNLIVVWEGYFSILTPP